MSCIPEQRGQSARVAEVALNMPACNGNVRYTRAEHRRVAVL